MNKIDPIIAVKDVNASAEWYERVLGCKRTHGRDKFAVLEDENGEVLLCLHTWGEHAHPTMQDSGISPGNGLILYYKTDKIDLIIANIEKMQYPIEEKMHVNPNSGKKEFSIRDPDGYYLTITQYHKYEG